ncbi:MAG: hypothetical protein CME17_07830 [Gemmatimonadetes bacterium]|nr:hypothetical protein [Gemmatimonadota bacterium]|tara:strand:+ start:5827 stop:6864 length:1038 start_codon:yes stop_codon:yes gene_type:complete
MDPQGVPMIEVVIDSEVSPPPAFSIGHDDDWKVEWRSLKTDDELPNLTCEVSREPFDFIMKTRNGWYIEPDPLHSLARRAIRPAVVIIILSLLIHTLEPGLVASGLLSESFAGSYRIGPLDYPKLLFFSFPVFIVPILFRIVANLRDIRRQNRYIASPIEDISLLLHVHDNSVELMFQNIPVDVMPIRSRIQVGMIVPEREKMLEALGRDENQQSAPGMSTRLPDRRITAGEELGTGVGESIPLAISHPRLLLLEPLRVMDSGNWMDIASTSGRFTLNGPSEIWPGSIYSALIAIHWEVVVEAIRDDGTRMKWVKPILIPDREGIDPIAKLPVRSGRVESADQLG